MQNKTIIRNSFTLLAICAAVFHFAQNLKFENMILSPFITSFMIIARDLIIALVISAIVLSFIKINSGRVAVFSAIWLLISLFGIAGLLNSTVTINIPDNYTGKVYIFVSNEERNDLNIDSKGIGYMTRSDYESKFIPRIIYGNREITSQVHDWSKQRSPVRLKSGKMCQFIRFYTPGSKPVVDTIHHYSAASLNVDTSRLYDF